jgi:hypothetical protein
MNDSNPSSQIARPRRPAWNKGKLTGPKPPLRPGHVWSIRAKLQLDRRTRDLALSNLAAQLLLGHTRIESTVRYLGAEVDDALEIAEKIEV